CLHNYKYLRESLAKLEIVGVAHTNDAARKSRIGAGLPISGSAPGLPQGSCTFCIQQGSNTITGSTMAQLSDRLSSAFNKEAFYTNYRRTFSILRADTRAQREECFRLRYQVYVEENGFEDPAVHT